MSRSKENTTSSLEIPNLSRRRTEIRTSSSRHVLTRPSDSWSTRTTTVPLLRTRLSTSRVYRSSIISSHFHLRSLRPEPPSNDPLLLPLRSINLRPTCHQCCPGSVSCRISFGIGCFPLPFLVSSGCKGSLWYPILGGLGRRTVGGLPPVTGVPFRVGVLREGCENLIVLAGAVEIVFSSAGLLGGAGGVGLSAFDMLMRLRGSNSSSE